VKIRTNRAWHEFKLREDVPKRVLKRQFDWTNKAHALHCDYSDGFISYKGCWYHLSQFERTTVDGWTGQHCDSFYSGVLIRLSSDGERYQIATFTT
jgi:hypothetical protein